MIQLLNKIDCNHIKLIYIKKSWKNYNANMFNITIKSKYVSEIPLVIYIYLIYKMHNNGIADTIKLNI